jgi:hypothetical protein
MVNTLRTLSNPSKILIQTAINMITRSKEKLANQKAAASGPLVKIGGFRILKSNDIRFTCETEEEADHLWQIDWREAYEGLAVRRQPKFEIVIHGIPIEEMNLYTGNLNGNQYTT